MHGIIECLQTGIHNLRLKLEWIKAWGGEDPRAALAHLRQIYNQLSTCGDLIREAQSGSRSVELQSAICEYRESLQRIQEALPILQARLLDQRSRLEPQQAHVQAASNWAQCSKDTL